MVGVRLPRLPREESLGILVMVATAVATTLAAAGVIRTALTLVAVCLAEAGLLMARHLRRGARLGLVLALAGGFTALFLAPRGIAEIPILVAASRLPRVSPPSRLQGLVWALAVVFGVSVAIISDSAVGLLSGVGVWLLAQRTVASDELQAERDRAVALLTEIQASRDNQAEAAAVQERARIARDVHDVLAHSLAGLSLHLQAVRALAVAGEVSGQIVTQLDLAADLAREGMAEARDAVGALRTGSTGKGIESLPALIGQFPGTVRLRTTGLPRPLPAPAGQAVYRAVQESLTNAARYAPGAAVTITLEWSADELAATISDEGSTRPGVNPADVGAGLGVGASGHGLRGLSERFAEAGGRLSAGPAGRGWVVLLAVPISEQDLPIGQHAPPTVGPIGAGQ